MMKVAAACARCASVWKLDRNKEDYAEWANQHNENCRGQVYAQQEDGHVVEDEPKKSRNKPAKNS